MSAPLTSGVILSVSKVTLGSTLAADALTTATTVTVDDTSDFDTELGGTLSIGGAQYVYSAVDNDTGIITFTPGLAAGAFNGDRVDLWDTALAIPQVEYRALVELPGTVDNGDAINAAISHPLIPLLADGIRDPGTGESVVLQEQNGEWVVTDRRGGVPSIQVLGTDSTGLKGIITFPDGVSDYPGEIFEAVDIILGNRYLTFQGPHNGGVLAPGKTLGFNVAGGVAFTDEVADQITQRADDITVQAGAAPGGAGTGTLLLKSVGAGGGAGLGIVQLLADKLQFGTGPLGAYYFEEVQLDSTQVIGSGAVTTATNLANIKLRSDYGSKFNLTTGVWTCPADGPYLFTMQASYQAWVNGSRSGLYVHNNTTGNDLLQQDLLSNAVGRINAAGVREVTAGDQVVFRLFQNTAANQSPVNNPSCFISVRREL